MILSVDWAFKNEFSLVAILVGKSRGIFDVALHGPDPALLAADNGDRLLLDHGLFEIEINFRGLGKIGAPFAKRGFLAELLLDGFDFLGDLLPLLIV